MTYDSPDIIPAKIYFKILETGEVELLSTKIKEFDKLVEIWEKINEEYVSENKSQKQDKSFDLYRRIEILGARYESIKLSVIGLKIEDDQELKDLLIKYGYKFSDDDEEKDLDRILRESESLQIKIENLRNQLPKVDTKKKLSFDETVLSYAAFTGSGFIDTNKITLTQYDALINIGNQKMKALESHGQGKNNKTRSRR